MPTLTVPKETVVVPITAAIEGDTCSGGASEVFWGTGEVTILLIRAIAAVLHTITPPLLGDAAVWAGPGVLRVAFTRLQGEVKCLAHKVAQQNI